MPLCAGRDPDWWTPGHEQARLAMRICGLCTGCPDNDPRPHGVIRQGVPYGDTGKPLPLCPNCAHPHTGYRGGDITLCRRCAVPDVPIPSAPGSRDDHILSLARQGMGDVAIAAQVGLKPSAVREVRRRAGFQHRRSPLSVLDRASFTCPAHDRATTTERTAA